MPYHMFTLGGCKVEGVRVEGGETVPFSGTLRNHYTDLGRASLAARRKYRDQSITVTSVKDAKTRYRVDLDQLLAIAEKVN